MFRVENLSAKTATIELQHIVSKGRADLASGNTTFLLPSCVFPNPIEIYSIVLFHRDKSTYKNPSARKSSAESSDDIILTYCYFDENEQVQALSDPNFVLRHNKETMLTTKMFDPPLKVKQMTPFFFTTENKITDALLTVTYKNM